MIFRRNRNNYPDGYPLHEQEGHIKQVVDSLEASGLDKNTTLVLGGGVLALMGIRPARDVDVMVPGTVFSALQEAQRTPGGLYVVPKFHTVQPFLEARSTPLRATPLSLDITHPHGLDNRSSNPALDEAFLETLETSGEVAGYHYLSLENVMAHKEDLHRRKDRKDIKRIQRYLRGNKSVPKELLSS